MKRYEFGMCVTPMNKEQLYRNCRFGYRKIFYGWMSNGQTIKRGIKIKTRWVEGEIGLRMENIEEIVFKRLQFQMATLHHLSCLSIEHFCSLSQFITDKRQCLFNPKRVHGNLINLVPHDIFLIPLPLSYMLSSAHTSHPWLLLSLPETLL